MSKQTNKKLKWLATPSNSNLFLFLIFALATVVTVAILFFFLNFNFAQILDHLVTLIAVFSGAYFAFAFSRNRESKKAIERDATSANLALFNLIDYCRSLLNYRAQIIEPTRENRLRFYAMSPDAMGDFPNQNIDYNSLGFMLKKAETANLLGEISKEEKSFRIISSNIRARSKHHTETAQPKLEKAGFKEGEKFCLADVKNALGDRDFSVLQSSTTKIIEDVDQSIDGLTSIIDEMHKTCVELFPGLNFIRFTLPEE